MSQRLPVALLGLAAFVFTSEGVAAVGRTPGQFSVDQDGAANYQISIWAPPGPRGVKPNISLVYNSRSGIGPLGVGWTIAGLGSITRCNLTWAQDGAPAAVGLATSDGYCINGSRLRLTGGTYGTAGSTYQTEIADFSNVTANGTAGNGPEYFTVQGQNGLTYYYGYKDANGNGANSEVLATGSSTASMWLLSKVVDRSGNNFVINYSSLTGTSVPSNILWTPTSAGSSSYSYKMQFNYNANGANVPQSSVTKYIGGTLVTNSDLLSSIEIFSGSTVVKDYFLTYTPSSTTARYELTSLQECPSTTQSASNCLAPTTITYQSGATGVYAGTATTALSSISSTYLSARYDLNGDGYPDLIYINGSTVYVAFGSSSGYGTPVNTGIPSTSFLVGNLTGGTLDGILADKSGTWYYYTWNGSSFAGVSTGLAYDSTAQQYQLADVNGDGLPDLVALYLTYNKTVGNYAITVVSRLNTGAGASPTFASTTTTSSLGWANAVELQTPDMQFGKLRRYDFNGDGRDDLVLLAVQGTSPNFSMNTYELISSGGAFTATSIASESGTSYVPVFFTNWNDDACTDFVSAGILYVSGCDGSPAISYALTGTVVAAMDWNGDGRTDLMVANGSTLGVYLSTGAAPPSLASTTIPYSSGCQYVTMDSNADGLDDLGCLSSSSLTYRPHNGSGQPADLATSFVDGFGNSASPTYVPITQSSYTENPYWASNAPTPSFPDKMYMGPMYVVSEVIFSDPSTTSGTYNQTFGYYEGWTNLQGRGFEGFWSIRKADSRYVSPNLLVRYQYYEQQFPWTGQKYMDILTTGVFYPLETVSTPNTLTQATLSSTANQERYFPYFTNVTRSQWEVGGTENGDLITTTSTAYTFDSYGNATNVVATTTDNDPNSPYTGDTWTTNIANTTDISVNKSADVAAWCLNMLDETQIAYTSTLAGSSSVTRTKTFTPDTPANCRIKTLVTEPTSNSGLYKVTEALAFDSFGNVNSDTITGANMPSSPASRLTTSNWGTTGQFLNSQTDPSGATTTWTYSSAQSLTFGVPDSAKNANNLTTSWGYDGFGRKTKETRPDGTSTTWTWTLCTSHCGWSNSVYQVAQTAYQTNGTTVMRTDTDFFDPIDRVTETSGPTVTGTASIVQTLYNSFGLLVQKSLPFLSGATAYQQTYSFDVLNRLLQASRPISSTNSNLESTSYAYAGRTHTTTDPLGNTKTTITDVNGGLRRTKDAIGYNITRALDAAGSVTGVSDNVGNTSLWSGSYVYGLKPFLVASTDADRGTWAFTVDSLGELISWSDAKSKSFSATYDSLSRRVTRTEPDLFTQWTWGSTPASDNVGQLIAECTGTTGSSPTTCGTTPTYSESRTFDTDGRLSTRSITQSGNPGNDPGGVFLYTLGYSATTGLPSTLTYPTSTSSVALNIQYGYQYGLLQSVTDTTDTTSTCGTTCTLWTANAVNGFGQTTQETLGNGVVTNRTYDAVTSWLTSATAGVGGGAALLNQSYEQDENGNVTQRQNNNQGLTENFTYDADYRLTCATLTGTSCSTPTFVYDSGVAGPGNITSQAGVGTYTYPAPGQIRPHAVTSITGTFNGIVNPSFTYDSNGNMTGRGATANVTWSSYNYPTSISASDSTGSEEVQFNYGPDRQRWEQIYTVTGGVTEQTYYIGGLVDLVFSSGTTNYRHYIYAGREPIAVYSRTAAGVNTMSYMLEDHQGGVSAIVSSAGTTDVDESFTAFGARRNPATWSGPPTTSDLNTIESLSRQGYTFHTSLGQSMGLNHMKGRVQDAISGRFLSPDPSISDPSNAQSYNRYSYVNNMPATMIDPSGFTLRKNCRNGFCPGDTNNLYSGMGGASSGGGGGGTEVDSDDDTGAFENDASGPSTQAWFTGSLADSDLPGIAETSPDTSGVGSPPDSTGASGGDDGATSTGLANTGSPAQSQDPTQNQNGVMPAGACNPVCPTVTIDSGGSSSVGSSASSPLNEGPLLAQDPIVDFFLENGGRIPNAADYAARYSKFGTGTQVPNPLPPIPPQNPWILFFQMIGQKALDFWDFTPSVLIIPCDQGGSLSGCTV